MTAAPEPRLRPLGPGGWNDDRRDLLRGRLAAADRYLSEDPDTPPMPAILGLLALHPSLGSRWLEFNGGLIDNALLDARDRELLILRVAWRTQSVYEWSQHVSMGTAAGLTADEIEAVSSRDLSGWRGRDRHLLGAVDEMMERHRVADTTWDGLAEHYDDAQLLELLFVIGAYLGLALVLNSVGLEPDGHAVGPTGLPALEEQQ